MVYLHTGPMGVHRACFFIARAGEPLPRSGIAREINLLSCASCLSSRTNSRALGIFPLLSARFTLTHFPIRPRPRVRLSTLPHFDLLPLPRLPTIVKRHG